MNLYTKKSQWDKPTEPAEDVSSSSAGPPPYAPGDSKPLGHEKGGLGSNNPFGSGNTQSDEALARRLQAEEDARAQGRPLSRGAADTYYNQASASPGYGQQQAPANYGQDLPPRPEGKKGFLGKLLGKSSSSSSPSHYQQGYPPQQQQYYQGPPQGQYGYQPQQGYYGQGYPPQQQAPGKTHGGLGAGGGLALGAGAGLLGGMALGEAFDAGVSHQILFWVDMVAKAD